MKTHSLMKNVAAKAPVHCTTMNHIAIDNKTHSRKRVNCDALQLEAACRSSLSRL